MGKLLIECLSRRVKVGQVAKAVYTVTHQTANLKAELVFDDENDMQALNNAERGIDKVTDVLSFPSMDDIKGVVLTPEICKTEMDGRYIFIGSIVLCDEKIKAQAKEFGHSAVRERNYLIMHGLLHLLGYDHIEPEDKREMRDKEKEVLKILGVDE
ncbi:MAG: rRNA maturation RNase YbeY [Clostridia bacterium]|nr:rRNA maturation RNase YbeY [Clostridia bacterium]